MPISDLSVTVTFVYSDIGGGSVYKVWHSVAPKT